MKFKNFFASLAVAAAIIPATVLGAELWNSSGCLGSYGTYSSNSDITCATNITGVNVGISAWSASQSSGWDFAEATIGKWSGGLGVVNGAYDNSHTMDNSGNTDALLFHFVGLNSEDIAVALSSITTGYVWGDSDVSVLRYTGSSAPNLDNSTLNNMGTSWKLVGHYDNGSSASTFNINSTALSSSWWLISAYNSLYGSSQSDPATNKDLPSACNTDGVKVLAVAGTVSGQTSTTPEPAGIALVGLGLLGLMSSRRRINKALFANHVANLTDFLPMAREHEV